MSPLGDQASCSTYPSSSMNLFVPAASGRGFGLLLAKLTAETAPLRSGAPACVASSLPQPRQNL
jgi:hypothetical protein